MHLFGLIQLLISVTVLTCAINAQKQSLKVTTIRSSPFIEVVERQNGRQYFGYLIDLFNELRQRLNFTYDIFLTPDGRYGRQESDGSWTGLIGNLIKGEADVALAPLTINTKRREVIDFTNPYMTTGIAVAYKRPKLGEKIPFTGIEDLAKHKDIHIGVIRGGNTFNFFQHTKIEPYREIGDKLQNNPNFLVSTYQEGIQKVRESDNYAFIGEDAAFEYRIGAPPCNLMRIGEEINRLGYGIGLRKGSKWLDKFNMKLLQLFEDGTLHRLHAKWFTQNCPKPKLCTCQNDTNTTDDDDTVTKVVSTSSPTAAASSNYINFVLLLLIPLLGLVRFL